MEKFLYEYRPHFYLLGALATAVKLSDSYLALGCAAVLIACGLLVMKMRSEHRKRFS